MFKSKIIITDYDMQALVHTGTYFGILVEYCVDGTGIITGTSNSFPVKRGRGRPDKNQPSPGLSVTPGSVLVDVPVVGNVPAVVLPSMGWESSATEGTGVNQLRVVGVVHERMRPIQQVILKNGG